jgi:hypothetical protein
MMNTPWWLTTCMAACLLPVVALCNARSAATVVAAPGLADTTVLIVRHAEKPGTGCGLDAYGTARAEAYVRYFQQFRVDGAPIHIDTLVATADTPRSARPRLTLTPLSTATHVVIQQPFANDAVGDLADWLRAGHRGRTILIAWHHGKIPDLIARLGADPSRLFAFRHWSSRVFDDVVVLRFDAGGRLIPNETRLVREDFPISTAAAAVARPEPFAAPGVGSSGG